MAIKAFEANELSSSGIQGFDLRRALHITEIVKQPTILNNDTRSVSATLLVYICANRLVDITAWVDDLPQTIRVPTHRQTENFGKISFKVTCCCRCLSADCGNTDKTQYWNKLHDWPELIRKCHELFKKDPDPTHIIQGRLANANAPNTAMPCLSLLSSLAANDRSATAIRILSNFDAVGFHLSLLFKVCTSPSPSASYQS